MDGLPQLRQPILAWWFTGMQKVASGGPFLNSFGMYWVLVHISYLVIILTMLCGCSLERKHTGAYMAEKTTECLARYGLEEKVRIHSNFCAFSKIFNISASYSQLCWIMLAQTRRL